jgi:hypothetical protein
VRHQFKKNQIISGEIMHLAEKKFISFLENYFFNFPLPGDCQLPEMGGKLGRPYVHPAIPLLYSRICNRFRLGFYAINIAAFGANIFFQPRFDIYQTAVMKL